MTKTVYIGLDYITEVQDEAMIFIRYWVKEKRCPIPQAEIVIALEAKGIKTFTIINALRGLLKRGYIRRAIVQSRKSIQYVQLHS